MRALYEKITESCNLDYIFFRRNSKYKAEYNPNLSIRKNAKKMGVSPTTIQKMKENYFLKHPVKQMEYEQISLDL